MSEIITFDTREFKPTAIDLSVPHATQLYREWRRVITPDLQNGAFRDTSIVLPEGSHER